MKSTFSLCLLLIYLFIGVSCQNRYHDSSLKETEYYFDDRLSSISAEGDSVLWLGSENGDVWAIGKEAKDFYHLSYNRIYTLYTESVNQQVRTCWLGMRNEGLQQWTLSKGHADLMATYPMAFKGTSYSAYAIQAVDSMLFVATSQGLMRLNRNVRGQGQLQRVYPGTESETHKNGAPFVVKKLCLLAPHLLVAATSEGLLHVDIRTMKTWMSHRGEPIQHIAMYDGLLHLLSDGSFYIEEATGKVVQKIQLDFHTQYFYRAADTYCFIDMNHAWLTDDLKSFIPVSLRRQVPPESTNLSCFNESQGFTYLVTENALWRIPVHLDMFNDHAPIVAACSNDKEVYYVSSKNEIYLQHEDGDEATKVFDLTNESPIVNVVSEGRNLYYTNVKNEVRTVHLTDYLLSNFVLAHSQLLYQSEAKITTFGLHQTEDSTYLYMGIQDGLVRMDTQGCRVDTLHAFDNKYVTSFFSIAKSPLWYLTTLNHGVFMSKNGAFKVVETTTNQCTMRHMALTEDFPPKMVTLTSQSIVMQGSEDTIRVKGVNRVFFANDSVLYALPEYGLMRYVKRDNQLIYQDTYYRDIRFDSRGVVSQQGRIYLGSSSGILSMEPGNELSPHWIKMNNGLITRRLLWTVVLSLVGGLLLIYLLYRRYIVITVNHICARKHELAYRLNGLKQVSVLLHGEDEKYDTRVLEQKMHAIKLGHRLNLKEVDRTLDELSEQIMQWTGNSALLLFKHLDKQTEEIKDLEIEESAAYLKATSQVLATGVIDSIRDQALHNDEWLKRVDRVHQVLDDYGLQLQDTLSLEGVTLGLTAAINQLKEDMAIYPIAVIEERLAVLTEQYEAIFSETKLELIKAYCIQRRLLLLEQVAEDGVKKAQLSQIDVVMKQLDIQERMVMLRRLRVVDGRLEQLLLRQMLCQAMADYSHKRELIVEANDQLVNKQFDKSLEGDIASQTREMTEAINGFIHEIYEYMVRTDGRLVTEVLSMTNYEHQQAKVLGLLIANAKVKRTHIPGMLGLIGNLNPVISRLMKTKILAQKTEIERYKERHPASLAAYVWALI